jgi:hypothetical protein
MVTSGDVTTGGAGRVAGDRAAGQPGHSLQPLRTPKLLFEVLVLGDILDSVQVAARISLIAERLGKLPQAALRSV